ncbi:Uncharacterised protein [Vibrio cholerae]|nr:Uncharacterised protein [Vibrio cholerae]
MYGNALLCSSSSASPKTQVLMHNANGFSKTQVTYKRLPVVLNLSSI